MQRHTTWHNITVTCVGMVNCVKGSNVVECALLVYLLCQPVHLSIPIFGRFLLEIFLNFFNVHVIVIMDKVIL